MEESDYIFFAGDGIFGVTRTLENVADKLYAVGGNCDNSLYPEELVIDVEKVRFLIVHGHRFHDKLDLVYRAKEVGADTAFVSGILIRIPTKPMTACALSTTEAFHIRSRGTSDTSISWSKGKIFLQIL